MRKKTAQRKEKVMHGNGDCRSKQMREKTATGLQGNDWAPRKPIGM